MTVGQLFLQWNTLVREYGRELHYPMQPRCPIIARSESDAGIWSHAVTDVAACHPGGSLTFGFSTVIYQSTRFSSGAQEMHRFLIRKIVCGCVTIGAIPLAITQGSLWWLLLLAFIFGCDD